MNRNLFWTLLEPEHPKAEAFCRKLAGNRDEGDDLYQDALLKALTKFDSLRDHDAFRPWLYRIVVTTFRNRHRQFWWRRRVRVADEVFENERPHDPEAAWSARRWLERGMAVLLPDERALVLLFEIDGWSIADLSRMLDKREGTIKSRLARARRKMREEILKYLSSEKPKPESSEADYAVPGSETSTQ